MYPPNRVHFQIWSINLTAASAHLRSCHLLKYINPSSQPLLTVPHTYSSSLCRPNVLPASSLSPVCPLHCTPCPKQPVSTMSTSTSTCMRNGQLRAKKRRVCRPTPLPPRPSNLAHHYSSKKPFRWQFRLRCKINMQHIHLPVLYVFHIRVFFVSLTTHSPFQILQMVPSSLPKQYVVTFTRNKTCLSWQLFSPRKQSLWRHECALSIQDIRLTKKSTHRRHFLYLYFWQTGPVHSIPPPLKCIPSAHSPLLSICNSPHIDTIM